MKKNYDVIVIGGGHAGCEAAAAAARLGAEVLLVTHKKSTVGTMSCNPSIGGVAKGIIVKEVDALDGLMARAIDMAGIHFKTLNSSKGPAVWGPRAQADRKLYKEAIQKLLSAYENLTVYEGEVTDILIKDSAVTGIMVSDELKIDCSSVVLTTGTFLGGVIHIGKKQLLGGRMNDKPSNTLAKKN